MNVTQKNAPIIWFLIAEACLELCQTSKMERFAKVVNVWKPLNIFTKRSILDSWKGSEYVSGISYNRC